MTRFCRRLQFTLSILTVFLLTGNLLVFGWIAAGIGRISDHLDSASADPVIVQLPLPGTGTDVAAGPPPANVTASGNIVHLSPGAAVLPAGPRTVEVVASYLGVTPDTVRDSYIPAWIAAGHMTAQDRLRNRWLIPDTFAPYRPK